MSIPLVLLVVSLSGCTGDAGHVKRSSPEADTDTDADTDADSDTDSDTDTDVRTDADGDGSYADDCDDADPAVHPGAAELCDGIDQDCDGVVDDGVPSDGAGCSDPGWPTFPETVDTIHLTLRTGTGTYDGTDDGRVSVCLSADLCLSPYKASWNDLEPGVLDVSVHEGLGVPRATLDRVTIATTDGSNLWRPVGVEIALDGERVHCRDLDVDLGSDSGETPSWTDPDGLGLGCDTVFDATLTHGPLLGAVGAEDAHIWYRTDATRHVVLRVAADESLLAGSMPVHHGYPAAVDDFTETVDVVGLASDTRYAYSIEVDGETFGPWGFRTAPALGSPGRFKLAFGSCSKNDEQPVFGAVLAWDPDVFLFLGDSHYGNTSDLADLRQFYRWAHERPLRADLLAETSILATWDDHDFVGNNTDGSDAGRETALRVFEEYWANPSYGTADTPGVYTRQAWGDIEIFLVDDRYHRGVDGTFLGVEQEAWLLDALEGSTATFKLVASGSQFTPYGSSDSWASYPDSWDSLREGIVTRGVEGVVLLAGDIHRFELRVLEGAAGGYALPEITSSPLAYPTPSTCGSDASEPDREICLDGEDGYVGVEFDTLVEDPTLTVTFFDTAGGVRDSWSTTRAALAFPEGAK